MSPSTSDPLTSPTVPYKQVNGHSPDSGPATAEPPAAAPPATEQCPRCSGKLIDPAGLGWCKACGYCRATENANKISRPASLDGQHKPSRFGAAEFVQLLTKAPPWLWTLLGGAAAVAATSIAASFLLPAESYSRALWSTTQVALGLLTILTGQIWALILLAPRDDRLGAKDAIIPFRLWIAALKKLPETVKPVWLGAWGLTAVLCAVFVIGGFSYWYQFYKPKKLSDRGLRDAVAAAENSGKSLEESIEDFANSQDLTKKKADAKKKAEDKVDRRPTVQCVVIGYLLGERGELNGLVIATLRDGQLSFAGVVRKGLTPAVKQELMEKLPKITRPDPLFPGLRLKAVWVKPEIYCEVHQSGFNAEDQLETPVFKNLLQ